MRSLAAATLTLALALAAGSAARAQTPACDPLTGDAKAVAAELLASQYPYDCCDETIGQCLKAAKVCRLAWRLAEDVCRRAAAGQDKERIVRALSRRARSMMPGGKRATIDLTDLKPAGAPAAPVEVVEYACARCPYCAKSTPKLHEAVTSGPLKGKARLFFKTFPIRSHEYSKEAGLGFVAAARMGDPWPFVLHTYAHFDLFCLDKRAEWAAAVGLDAAEFTRLLEDPKTRDMLIESKKEGLRNKVEATPTFFIDGREYVGDLDLPVLMDVVEEAWERAQGMTYR